MKNSLNRTLIPIKVSIHTDNHIYWTSTPYHHTIKKIIRIYLNKKKPKLEAYKSKNNHDLCLDAGYLRRESFFRVI